MQGDTNVVRITDLTKYFPIGGPRKISRKRKNADCLKAVDGVKLAIKMGDTLGLAGESGCGKTTLAKILLKLTQPTSGNVIFSGVDIGRLKSRDLKAFRRSAQMVFQDPYESLNPRFRVRNILKEPLEIHGIGRSDKERRDIIETVLSDVGLNPAGAYMDRFPHEMSGGERQRTAIARAVILEPVFLIADEPVSMLDVSVKAGVLNLLKNSIEKRNLTCLFISHDISMIRYLCNRTAIMYLGKIVEMGRTEDVIARRYHPYTEALLEAVPNPNPDTPIRLDKIRGEAPNPMNLPSGCRFHPRCTRAMDRCSKIAPEPVEIEKGHFVECHLYTGA